MAPIAHWDEVEARHSGAGHLSGQWRDLGRAAGTKGAGVKRIEIDPGKWSTPAHCQGAEEEIFYVLGGSGLSWQDDRVYEVGPGDCIVHLPGLEVHTLRAGPDGLDVLAFGTRVAVEIGELPRAGVGWLLPTWVDVGKEPHPWAREIEAGEPPVGEPAPRPPNIVNEKDVEEEAAEEGDLDVRTRYLGKAAGSQQAGLNVDAVAPGKLNTHRHCHSAEEEIFVVLDGEGVLFLGDEEIPVRRGHVVARPPGTRVAHAFRAGDGGLTVLLYGTREPNDIVYYPELEEVFLRGVGVRLPAGKR